MSAQGKGLLSMVGTPIGNLGDASPRVIDALQTAQVVLCEDTRVTAKLLNHFDLRVPLLRCDENVIAQRVEGVLNRLWAGEHVAFVAGLRVEVIPGPSAVICALVASGLPMDHFFFEGFLPRKAGPRSRRLQELASVPGALVCYESPHRVAKTLESIAEVFPRRRVALVRELTKVHEEVLRDVAPALLERVGEGPEVRGECVLVIEGPVLGEQNSAQAHAESLDEAIAEGLAAGESKSGLAKRLAKTYGLPRSQVYERLLKSEASPH